MHKTVFLHSTNTRGFISAVIRPEELPEFEKLGFVDHIDKMQAPISTALNPKADDAPVVENIDPVTLKKAAPKKAAPKKAMSKKVV